MTCIKNTIYKWLAITSCKGEIFFIFGFSLVEKFPQFLNFLCDSALTQRGPRRGFTDPRGRAFDPRSHLWSYAESTQPMPIFISAAL